MLLATTTTIPSSNSDDSIVQQQQDREEEEGEEENVDDEESGSIHRIILNHDRSNEHATTRTALLTDDWDRATALTALTPSPQPPPSSTTTNNITTSRKKRTSQQQNNGAAAAAANEALVSLPTARQRQPRLIAKDGSCLFRQINVPELRLTCRNWFHLLIECSWRSVLVVFAACFVGSWLFFALFYYVIAANDRPEESNQDKRCIANVHDFVSAFLFSMESQHTIGYGMRHRIGNLRRRGVTWMRNKIRDKLDLDGLSFRYMTTACPAAHFVLVVHLVVGVLMQTMAAGLVVAKVLRPKKRLREMRFSRVAVVGPLDGGPSRNEDDGSPPWALQVRVADVQHRLFLAESHVRMYVATSRLNERGVRELVGLKDINVGYDSGWDRVLLLWPLTVRHIIDDQSPLYGLSRQSLLDADFEIIMTIEGIVEATGMTFQARTSFTPDEILWAHRFRPMTLANERIDRFDVHHELFNATEPLDPDDLVIPDLLVDETAEERQKEQEEIQLPSTPRYASGFL